jgi:bifunctional DNA-binding transcriptional regulator/antitoxin component of YhaV-PrlF toxin-antitoxin module
MWMNVHAVGRPEAEVPASSGIVEARVGPVQREMLRHEVAVGDEVVLLDDDGSEVGGDRVQYEVQTLAALGPRGVVDHVLGDEIVQCGGVPRLLTSEQILDDVLGASLAHGNSIPTSRTATTAELDSATEPAPRTRGSACNDVGTRATPAVAEHVAHDVPTRPLPVFGFDSHCVPQGGGSRSVPVRRVLIGVPYNDAFSAYNEVMVANTHVMTVSQNGQVSIPADTRARWKARQVIVVDLGDRVVMRPLGDDMGGALEGKYRGRGPSTDRSRKQARAADALHDGPR